MNKKTLSVSWMRQGIVLLAMAGLLQGCGGGGGGHGVVNANPTGYYGITGTASVKSDSDNSTPVDIIDLQGMVYNNHLYMLSTAAKLSYEGPISVSGTGFSSTVTIYSSGVKVTTASVVGTINAGTSITGTLTGTGSGNGTFALNYDATNSQQSTLAIGASNGTVWGGVIISGSVASTIFTVNDTNGNFTITNISGAYTFGSCGGTGTIMPITGTYLYTISATLTGCVQNPTADGTYSGIATTRDHDRNLVVVLADSKRAFSVHGEFR